MEGARIHAENSIRQKSQVSVPSTQCCICPVVYFGYLCIECIMISYIFPSGFEFLTYEFSNWRCCAKSANSCDNETSDRLDVWCGKVNGCSIKINELGKGSLGKFHECFVNIKKGNRWFMSNLDNVGFSIDGEVWETIWRLGCAIWGHGKFYVQQRHNLCSPSKQYTN